MHEDSLSSVLGDFARTLVVGFSIQGILDRLVERIVEILDVTGAGVTLISPGMAPQYVAASNELALRFERLQTELGEGPCLTAYGTGKPVAVPDLARDDRYPRFGPAATAAGMAAVFTFPLRHGDGYQGALDLYRDTVGGLAPAEMAAAQTLADVVAAYLLNAQAREDARVVSDQFRDSSLHDALTGLPNRVLLQQRLTHTGLRARRSHAFAAVLFADLDRFKTINDTYGHGVGDEVLVAVAERLTRIVRPGDTLARVSGDEFVFVCEDLTDPADAQVVAARIAAVFTEPFLFRGLTLRITASVGIAYTGPGEAVSNQLVVDADIAMYQAKRHGGATHRVVDLVAARDTRARHHLGEDLSVALDGSTSDGSPIAPDAVRADSGGLDVAYQPIVRCGDGAFTGVEALLRWTHPEQGPVPALTAIGVAEHYGQIATLGLWVLHRACRERTRWSEAHPGSPLELSVNISAQQLRGTGFTAAVARVLDHTGMDPAALILEVTESVLIDDGDHALTVLDELRSLGVRVALDDFGTGYSSLSYLRRLPLDILKIDQQFITDIARDHADAAIVAAITDLAHALGLTVTAEGVETADQHDMIIKLGCDHAQGFYYSHPLTSPDIAARLIPGLNPIDPVAESAPAGGVF